MKISTKGRYALRILLDIAMNSKGDYLSVKEISERQNITPKYMEQIVSVLYKSGYIISRRGNAGGYKLKKEPEEYVLGDILRLMEGDISSSPCTSYGHNCPMKRECYVSDFWVGLDRVVADYINSKTLKDLMPRRREMDSYLL